MPHAKVGNPEAGRDGYSVTIAMTMSTMGLDGHSLSSFAILLTVVFYLICSFAPLKFF